MNNDTRNMILAIALSALVLLGWGFLSERFMPTPKPAATAQKSGMPAAPGTAPAAATAAPTSAAPTMTRAQALRGVPRVKVTTPSLDGSISLKGATFDDLRMVRHTDRVGNNAQPARLLSPAGAPGAYFARFGWTGQGVAVPDANSVWTTSAPTLVPGKPITLSWTNPTGQRFELIVAVDDGYLFTVKQRVVNQGGGPVAVRPFGLLSRANSGPDANFDGWTHHVGPMGVFDGAAEYGVNYDTLDEEQGGKRFTGNNGWLGFTDKYWLTALAPAGDAPLGASFRRGQGTSYQADYALEPKILAPGQASENTTRLFAGAKEKKWLDAYEADGTLPVISDSIDWGYFEWFMRPIFSLLIWLFNTIGNFGWAIIALTFIVRLLMYPIFDRQFRSMAAMRAMQPKMKEIQERHKDDRTKMQTELLELYKREKINPAAGCLPIFLQIPVFYALYKVLTVTVEMRHQPWELWIKDLSAPDPLTPINLFGLLNFDPPGLLHLGVLPILLGVTMWLQFRLNPAPMDDIQKQIFSIMPWVLMFAMAPFAAGLQLYWVVSNILGIAQQKYLYSKYDAEKIAARAGLAAKT
ncbi:membrane protein insertase YidC [Sphingomonas sp. LHG3406-1]|uniref:membrane protein insertase YidC n=1 Tax=Sphingomonas sp. LHG3406-1 TaxID=2804617 RepID=UPI00260C180D|nr:membrane protein insertase YidC [Sphingomonas sp. LHG3406-1]